MTRRYEEILEDLKNGEISNEEAAQELERFSTSSLRQEVAKLPEVEKERDELRTRVDKLEKAPLRTKAFKDYGVDYDSLRPAEIRAIENYDGELEPEMVGAFVEDLGLPTTQVAPPEQGQPPNAAAVAQAARTAPSGQRLGRPGQITPAEAAEWRPEKWMKFMEEHPDEAEAILQGKVVTV